MKSVEEQYWQYGLHDALITDIRWGDLTPDNKTKPYRRNYVTLVLDTQGALYENVKEITFYNASAAWKGGKVKDFSYYKNLWWMSDQLKKDGNRYTLDLELDDTASNKRVFLQIQFEQMDVVR